MRASLLIEFLTLIGLAFIGVFVARLSLRGQQSQDESVEARRIPSPQLDRSDSLPFDHSTSVPLPEPHILTGAAWVTDGDTITICKTQIRLFGIDAPELDHPYGKKAKWALHALCKGQMVRAEITEVDHYGRTVARCTLPDGRDLSAEMVKQGLAIDWAKFSGGRYRRFETPDARRKLWLADARQKGHMHVWEKFETRKADG